MLLPLIRRNKKISLLITSVLAVLCLMAGTNIHADTIVRAFKSTEVLQPGWIVALDKDQKDTVTPAPNDDPARMYGVVIDPSKAPVTLQPMQGVNVYVATSGTYPVLVTNQNGKISPGDYISMSATNGIGAKATSSQDYVLGQALESFDGAKNVITTSEDSTAIGRINVTVLPGKNPLVKNDAAVPEVLRRAGTAVAGKAVSPVRVYGALAVFIATTLVTISVLWVGIRSGMIAIGRNPLSGHSIVQGLAQVVVAAILVFVVGIFGVYLLLRL